MPEERRRSIRLACSVLIELQRGERRWVGVCGDISEGGVRCSSLEEPCDILKQGDEVRFLTILPVGRIEGTAGVLRVSTHSLALEFRLLEPGARDLVRRYVLATRAPGSRI